MTVYFTSDKPYRNIPPKTVPIAKKDDYFYSIYVSVDLLAPPTEIVFFNLTWTIQALTEGVYKANISASSTHNEIDPQYSHVQTSCEFNVVKGTPIITEISISNIYYVPEIDRQRLFVHPNQSIEVNCKITCLTGIKNVTLLYAVNQKDIWHSVKMENISENIFSGKIPGRGEGELFFYIESFSLTEKRSTSSEYVCVVADLDDLNLKANITAAATIIIIIICCIGVFILKMRSLTEWL